VRDELRLRNEQVFLEGAGKFNQDSTKLIETGRNLAFLRYQRMLRAVAAMGLPLRGGRTPASYAKLVHRLLPMRYDGNGSVDIAEFLTAVDVLTEDITIASYAPNEIASSLATSVSERRAQQMLGCIDRGVNAHRKKTLFSWRRSSAGKAEAT